MPPQELPAGGADQRVQNCFEFFQRRRIAENFRAQCLPVNAAVFHHSIKNLGDCRHRSAALGQLFMDFGIGIENRHTKIGKHLRRGAFAHADGAC